MVAYEELCEYVCVCVCTRAFKEINSHSFYFPKKALLLVESEYQMPSENDPDVEHIAKPMAGYLSIYLEEM